MAELGFDDGAPQYDKIRNIVHTYLKLFEKSLQQASIDGKPFRTQIKTKPEFGDQYFEIRASYFENET
jgi:hypothetical protein